MKQGEQVRLGYTYRDVVHGIRGIAVAQCRYFTGCDRVLIEWMDGSEIRDAWLDIIRVEPAELAIADLGVGVPTSETGGPQSDPPRRGSR